jgi:hypothetical protein
VTLLGDEDRRGDCSGEFCEVKAVWRLGDCSAELERWMVTSGSRSSCCSRVQTIEKTCQGGAQDHKKNNGRGRQGQGCLCSPELSPAVVGIHKIPSSTAGILVAEVDGKQRRNREEGEGFL